MTPAARFSAYLATRLDRPVGWSLGRGRAILARFWAGYTGWWHGQTVTGLDNIPRNTAAILVWYHGPLPVDYMYNTNTLQIPIDGSMPDKYHKRKIS